MSQTGQGGPGANVTSVGYGPSGVGGNYGYPGGQNFSPMALGQMNQAYNNPYLGATMYANLLGQSTPFSYPQYGYGYGPWQSGGPVQQPPQQPTAATFTGDVNKAMTGADGTNVTNLIRDVRGIQGLPTAQSSFGPSMGRK